MAVFTATPPDPGLFTGRLHGAPRIGAFDAPYSWSSSHALGDEVFGAVFSPAARPLTTFGQVGTVAGSVVEPASVNFVNRIHIILQGASFGRLNRRPLGFLLSNLSFDIEVWNAFESARTLNSAAVVGDSNVTITNPYALPTAFGPRQSRLYEAVILAQGSPRVAAELRFDFASVGPEFEGRGLLDEGSRVLPFTLVPDGEEDWTDSKLWNTLILTGYDDSEQRVQIRRTPRRRIGYRVTQLSVREAQLLQSYLYGWAANVFGVPLWWNATPLTAAYAPGSVEVFCDTVNKEFEPGQPAIVFRNPFEFEVFNVASVLADRLVVDGELTTSTGSVVNSVFVMPMKLANLASENTVERFSSELNRASLVFEAMPT